ncbi:MAG: hypothetical protein HYU30_06985 [Chloroflexi bacterium]|nr:hypothetical protein [Chloroflexota bacterium]
MYVQARTPVGVLKKEWVTVGADVALETPAIIESVPDRDRYVFQKWTGMAGLVSPKISGTADQPVNVDAVYEHQFKVGVAAPYGSSGAGWYKQSATATVTVPPAVEKFFFLQDVFVEFAGYGKAPTMSLVVGEPVDLTALYRREVNLKVLALLVILPLGVAGLLAGDWRLRRKLGQGVLGPKRRSMGRGGGADHLAGDVETNE